MNESSAVEFAGNSRIHIALNVLNLERSRAFYEVLLGVAPAKVRPGYTKFEPQDPSVNLTLNEVKMPASLGQSTSHFGIQVKSTSAIQDATARLTSAGLVTIVEENTTCCYAVQDKVWATDPDGNQWEVFVVTTANTEQNRDQESTCCPTTQESQTAANCC